MDQLAIVYLPPEELTPYENNARIHTKEDIEAIKASIIEAGGFNDPIGIWGQNNLIVEGHGRRQAAIELGIKTVPCIRLDYMTEKQRRAYTLTHNKTAEISKWDYPKLDKELDGLMLEGFDLNSFGFEKSMIDWENVEEISKRNYVKPDSKRLRCPLCGGVDEKIRFVEVAR